jgi:hypothetical protein
VQKDAMIAVSNSNGETQKMHAYYNQVSDSLPMKLVLYLPEEVGSYHMGAQVAYPCWSIEVEEGLVGMEYQLVQNCFESDPRKVEHASFQ